ncbi:MAG: hypothetical protein R3D67_01030 [Hyphomicrobiaceae bacterium]
MTANRFFRLVWRMNALAIAGLCVLGLLLGTYALFQVTRHETRPILASGIAPTNPQPSERLTIGAFSWLEPARLLWAPVEDGANYRLGLHSKTASSIRNYVIYDVAQATARYLLSDHSALITDARLLRQRNETPASPPPPAKAILVSLVKSDTNGDGYLTRTDDATLLMAAADGSDVRALAFEPGRLLDARLLGDTEALIMMARPAGVEAIHIALADRKILKRKLISAAAK